MQKAQLAGLGQDGIAATVVLRGIAESVTSHAKLPSRQLLDVLASQVRNGCALDYVTHRMG